MPAWCQDERHTAVNLGEVTTACNNQKFDNCNKPSSPVSACSRPQTAGTAGNSTLGAALYYICEINLNCLVVGLAPLNISIGLDAGVYTPASVVATAGSIDLPTSVVGISAPVCGRQPMVWGTGYVAAYESALSVRPGTFFTFSGRYSGCLERCAR